MPFFGKRKLSERMAKKREVPDGLWTKCPSCGEIIFTKELKTNLSVCGSCDHHFQMTRKDRIDMLCDAGTFEEWDSGLKSKDVLKFTGVDSYSSKLEANEKKTGEHDAIVSGRAKINGIPYALGVMDFGFLGASMGSVVGEKVTRLLERAEKERLPVVLVCASGGARMYEGLFSLMQMAKTSGAIQRHRDAGLCYIPVLTHPTMAGVMASFATLGDVILAEPNALIGFAGPRVIKETTNADLPPGFQKSEFLQQHGLLDKVVPRGQLKETLAQLLTFMTNRRDEAPVDESKKEPESAASES